MSPSPKKTIPDSQGRTPKKGDKVVAHYLSGDKPRVLQTTATVAGLRDDGTLDLAASLSGRPVTMEAMGPCAGGRYSVGWEIPASSAPAEGAPAAGGAQTGANPGPLKPS